MDYDYVVNCANIAKEANVPHMAYVSSEGAKSSSFILYLKTKGEVNYDTVMLVPCFHTAILILLEMFIIITFV